MEDVMWIVVLVASLALFVFLALVVVRRGSGAGGLKVGPFELSARGASSRTAEIIDSVSTDGGAIATSTGDARLDRVEARDDLRAVAGQGEEPPKG